MAGLASRCYPMREGNTMAKYYCVLFDADNTLLNFDAAESKALAETLVNYRH